MVPFSYLVGRIERFYFSCLVAVNSVNYGPTCHTNVCSSPFPSLSILSAASSCMHPRAGPRMHVPFLATASLLLLTPALARPAGDPHACGCHWPLLLRPVRSFCRHVLALLLHARAAACLPVRVVGPRASRRRPMLAPPPEHERDREKTEQHGVSVEGAGSVDLRERVHPESYPHTSNLPGTERE